MLALTATMGVGLVGLASPASAGTNPVPFKASASGTITYGLFSLTYAGTGNASHMGTISDQSSAGALDYTETLTAANGDTLTLFDIQTIVSSAGPGMAVLTGQWSVIGGTGRFTGATGSGTTDVVNDVNSFTQTWHGAISY